MTNADEVDQRCHLEVAFSERIGTTDAEWGLIGPLLPLERGRGCRPTGDNRPFFEGMMWMARAGAQWRRLPSEYGKWNSLFRRYRRWIETSVSDALMVYAGGTCRSRPHGRV